MGPEIFAAGTLANIGTGASIGGGLLQVFGNLFEGESSSNKFKYQAGMSRMNAMINRQNADMERTIGEREAARSGMKTAFTTSNIRTGQAAQGGLVDSGSNADVVQGQHDVGLLDQETIRNSAARRAYGFDVKAVEDETSAGMYDKASRNAKTGSYIKAASSILGTAGSVSNKWLDAKKHGLYDNSPEYSWVE